MPTLDANAFAAPWHARGHTAPPFQQHQQGQENIHHINQQQVNEQSMHQQPSQPHAQHNHQIMGSVAHQQYRRPLPYNAHSQHPQHPHVQPLSSEEMMLQSRPHDHHPHVGAPILGTDAGIPGPPHPTATMAHSRHSLGSISVTDGESSFMDREGNDEGNSGPVGKGSKTARPSANNEHEMRSLFHQNKNRSLDEVASELQRNDRGANSERARQIFAMLWINQACSRGSGSVPRSRVYTCYAQRCAVKKVTVLNPASFGKLVRVLFPGLRTRRLGVRGESKYNYVDFVVAEESPEVGAVERPQTRPAPRPILPETAKPLSYSDSGYSPPADNPQPSITARPASVRSAPAAPPLAPSDNNNFYALALPHAIAQAHARASVLRHHETHSIYHISNPEGDEPLDALSVKTELGLSFSAVKEEAYRSDDPVVLPPIEPFLPPGTDPDSAKALETLYRSHCTSLVECIRWCKARNFFHLYTSLQGTLTQPVQRLFSQPGIAAWIEQCDCALYQRMVPIISMLALGVVPPPILEAMRSISNRLVNHIRQSFEGQPKHVVDAKEAPAALFATLVDRALRVNSAAHAAANMLASRDNRREMLADWTMRVRLRKVAEAVPACVMDDVAKLLACDVREILETDDLSQEPATTLSVDLSARGGGTQQPEGGDGHDDEGDNDDHAGHDGSDDEDELDVLKRWVALLEDLPARFPNASHAEIVWCVERVGTAVMRDITVAGGTSFSAWWATKVWIDEMVWFLAEKGAFLKLKSTRPALPATAAPGMVALAHTQQVAISNSDVTGGHKSAAMWWTCPPTGAAAVLSSLSSQQPIHHSPHQSQHNPSSFGAVSSEPNICLGVDCPPYGQSAPMPVSAGPQNNRNNKHNGGSVNMNTNMSTTMSVSVNDGASVFDSSHDDSGLGSEEEFKLEHASAPMEHIDSVQGSAMSL